MRLRLLLTAIFTGGTLLTGQIAPPALAEVAASPTCSSAAPHTGGSAATLTRAANSFGFRLFRQIATHSAGSNVFISPASVALALDMAYDGSKGNTHGAMAAVLGLRGLSSASVRAQAARLISALPSDDPQVQVQVANALWARAGFSFNPRFTQRIARSFGARIASADFTSPATITAINGWVSCATHGTINSIISKLKPEDVLVLLNALYFHGNWAAPFHNADTHPGTFTTSTGASKAVPFMSQSRTFSYAAGANYQAISLPYGNGRYAMRIVLPKAGTPIGSFMRQANANTWRTWTARLKPAEVALRLPRFTIRNDRLLTPDLAAMGMAPAFSTKADFTGICPRCFISSVLHKTYLQVDEKGTTASAVTQVIVGTTSIGANRVVLNVDRPFLVGLQDTRTGTMLFLGAISDPTS
jgi:serine protease inhibitor